MKLPRFTGTWIIIIAGFFSLLTLTPYILHTFSPLYQGLTVIRDKDFGNYYSRLQRALSGYPEEADNAITPVGSGISGLQKAGMERIVAVLFSWMRLPAPRLAVSVTVLFTFLTFLLFFHLYRLSGFSPWWALGITVTYFLAMFSVVTRHMHPGWSFLPALLGMTSFFLLLQKPLLIPALLAGTFLGMMPWIYFWSWMFSWGSCGFLFLLSLLVPERRTSILRHWKLFALVCVLVLSLSVPFLLQSRALFANPLYPEIAIRASFLYTRGVESWPRSILLALQVLLLVSLWKRESRNWNYLATFALVAGIFTVMHQNIIHGKVLMFASHFYPQLMLATLAAGAYALAHRIPMFQRIGITLVAALFLGGAFYDYFQGYRFLIPRAEDYEYQHLAPAIRFFEERKEPAVILSDYMTGRILTSWTPHGIIYTTHARFLLISDAEIAERYCVTEIATLTPNLNRVMYLEYNAILNSEEMRAHERALVEEACARVKANPKEYFRKYEITHVLWNKRERPQWVLDEEVLGLREFASGPEWVLWEVL